MFTGIIKGVGQVTARQLLDTGLRIEVDLSIIDCVVNLGDSIAVNGVCLTVAKYTRNQAIFDISTETLSKTLINTWDEGKKVNLEPALTLQTPLGGHLLLGHVDGMAKLEEIDSHDEFSTMVFSVEQSIGQFVATKGAISLDGISLTTNQVWDKGQRSYFCLMLVPHTLNCTTLGSIQPVENQQWVHVEVDQIARYIYRLNQFS